MNKTLAACLRNLVAALVLSGTTATATAQQAYYIHADHLNTPRLIENQSQQVVWRWDNDDPFGGNMANANPSGLGAFEFNLRFPGQYLDKDTNLHYNYYRDYSPEIGRYIESDPIGLDGGINTYTYVRSNPLTSTDPFGEAEHRRNQRPSTEQKHQEGQARQQQDRGNEVGDERRRPPRKRPPGYTGPWPKKLPIPGICVPLMIWDILWGYCRLNPGDLSCLIRPPADPNDPCKGDPNCA